MAYLDGAIGIKEITTESSDPVPTRGTMHVTGPTASVRDDPEAKETVLNIASFDGLASSAVTTVITDDVIVLDLEGQDAARVIRVTISESHAVHGIAPPTGAGEPRKTMVVLQGPVSVGRLELKHQSVSAPAGSRMSCPGMASYFLLHDSSIDLLYDATSNVWRVVP